MTQAAVGLHVPPLSQVFDCGHTGALPGTLVTNPTSSADPTVKRAYAASQALAQFFWNTFMRDSVDDKHMTLVSSVHYQNKYTNAFWQGSQMTYGDGDGQTLLDFTLSDDIIGHEFTHGVTETSLALAWEGESGGLNESISDVFGSMFRQWRRGQTAAQADWLLGADVIGPQQPAGRTCLRNLANPKDPNAMATQLDYYTTTSTR